MTKARAFREFTLDLTVRPKHDGSGVGVNWRAGRPSIRGYRPRKGKRNQGEITLLAARYAPPQPWTGPIRLDTHVTFKLPAKWVEMGADRLGTLPHFERSPDITNLRKQIEDALEGAYYVNDRQVCCGSLSKGWGEEPSVRIWVGKITPEEFVRYVRRRYV